MSPTTSKKSEIVWCLEQVSKILKEADNDVKEVRIAKLSESVKSSSFFSAHDKTTLAAALKVRDWDAVRKELENM